jgi:hypothetical protein
MVTMLAQKRVEAPHEQESSASEIFGKYILTEILIIVASQFLTILQAISLTPRFNEGENAARKPNSPTVSTVLVRHGFSLVQWPMIDGSPREVENR